MNDTALRRLFESPSVRRLGKPFLVLVCVQEGTDMMRWAAFGYILLKLISPFISVFNRSALEHINKGSSERNKRNK